MSTPGHCIRVVVAEDDADDQLLIEDAFMESGAEYVLQFVEDGEELLQYLRRKGEWDNPGDHQLPGLILLDLNMPRMNGMQALQQIKEDDKLRNIPVVIFTTSQTKEDIASTYALGANSFMTKPANFDQLIDIVKGLTHYWSELVQLPQECY